MMKKDKKNNQDNQESKTNKISGNRRNLEQNIAYSKKKLSKNKRNKSPNGFIQRESPKFNENQELPDVYETKNKINIPSDIDDIALNKMESKLNKMNLSKNGNKSNKKLDELLTEEVKVADYFSKNDFIPYLYWSALAARICYSSKSVNELLKDPKVINPKERAEFLKKIAGFGHFSIFSHSFNYKDVGVKAAITLGATRFKSYYTQNEPEMIGISLRHLLEEMNPKKYDHFFDEIAKIDDLPYHNSLMMDEAENVKLIGINENGVGYAMFVLEGISRVTTHQLVRHTALNYSQKSQRYVTESGETIVPAAILDSNDYDFFKTIDHMVGLAYQRLIRNGIRKEDARYILPHGKETTIAVSGPIPWLNDFINKRVVPEAQEEIRYIAKRMDYLLKKNV